MNRFKYFTIRELTKSYTAIENDIDNSPNAEEEENLANLINDVLDPLRTLWGKPIYINSGYRCEQLNKLVGGVKNSDHKFGMAADIDTRSKDNNIKLFNLAIQMNLPFKQIILEKGGEWIHISYNPNDIKRQVLYM